MASNNLIKCFLLMLLVFIFKMFVLEYLYVRPSTKLSLMMFYGIHYFFTLFPMLFQTIDYIPYVTNIATAGSIFVLIVKDMKEFIFALQNSHTGMYITIFFLYWLSVVATILFTYYWLKDLGEDFVPDESDYVVPNEIFHQTIQVIDKIDLCCLICQEDVAPKETIYLMACTHNGHANCYDQWWNQTHLYKNRCFYKCKTLFNQAAQDNI
jgi:hypothetical protein